MNEPTEAECEKMLGNLADAQVNEILNASDEQILAEAQEDLEYDRIEAILHRVMRKLGWIVPQTEEDVRQAEAELTEHPVELPARLKTPPDMPGQIERKTMNFGQALEQLKLGHPCTREGWNGPGQHIKLQLPTQNSKMTLPYLYIKTVQGDLVPWLASQTDMLAEDWQVVTAGGGPQTSVGR